MPSGITHMMISRRVIDGVVNAGRDDIAGVIRSNLGLYLLGSIAPDLPYMSPADGRLFDNEEAVADDLHYRKTNEVPLQGLAEAQAMFEAGEVEESRALFSFYLGYCSHLIADGIIHPFVRDKVGDYAVAKGPHRRLEMELDVLLAKRYFGAQVNGTDFQDDLDLRNESQFADVVYASYAKRISEVYGHNIKADYVAGWANAAQLIFGAAEGEFPKWYRKVTDPLNSFFKNYEDISHREDEIFTLRLPIDAAEKGFVENFMGKEVVHFVDDVVKKYYDVFPAVIQDAFTGVFEGRKDLSILVPLINLDTGRSLADESLLRRPVLWA